MSKSSRKGAYRENQWAKFIGGEKLSRLGYEGPDVKSPPLHLMKPLALWEVKSREALPDWLVGTEGWIGQMKREGADAIVFRQNRGSWYIIVEINEGDLEQIKEKPCVGPIALPVLGN